MVEKGETVRRRFIFSKKYLVQGAAYAPTREQRIICGRSNFKIDFSVFSFQNDKNGSKGTQFFQ